jgi:periplasmic protein TonB
MELKKNPEVDTERLRPALVAVGLVFIASFVLVAFSYSVSDGKGSGNDDGNQGKDIQFEQVLEEEPPPPEDTPPPPDEPEVPPPPTDEVNEVENNEEETKISIAPPDVEPPKVTNTPPPPPEKIVDFPEEQPSFPGGEEEMMRFIQKNIKYPEMAIQMGDQGRVYVQFVVETDGKITQVQTVRGVTTELDKEAERVVKSMPAWTPGKQRGRPVRVRYTVPIYFKLG